MDDPFAVAFRCKFCGTVFITDRSLTILMEHHTSDHPDQTTIHFDPVVR